MRLGGIGLAAVVALATTAARAEPAFVPTACTEIEIAAGLVPRIRCGMVSVPRDHDRPGAGSYALRVVVIASQFKPARAEPNLYISGGPGGPLTVYATAQARNPLTPDRDQILVDQRGTGGSEPALCPALDRALVAAFPTDPTEAARRRAVFAACRDQAIAAGIDLAQFGTVVTADDFETVRRALGIDRWNVFGVSYGTTVAMTLLARHPETIRAAVLDSIYPPDPILPPWRETAEAAREAFFAACAHDPACDGPFPDLAGIFRRTVQKLTAEPPEIGLPDEMGHSGHLTADFFAFVVERLVYYPAFYPGLPRLIAAMSSGDGGPVEAAITTLFAAESDPATGSRLSDRVAVDCRDRPRFHGPATASPADMTTLLGICDAWVPLGPPPSVPLDTPVPTLILAGAFDPNARPTDSRRVAKMIGPRATWIEFPGIGHSVRANSPCATTIVAAFLDRPDQALAAECAARAPAVRYLGPQ